VTFEAETKADGRTVGSGEVCMIVAVVGSICRHDWKGVMIMATMMLLAVMEDCKGLLKRWAVSSAVSLAAADEL